MDVILCPKVFTRAGHRVQCTVHYVLVGDKMMEWNFLKLNFPIHDLHKVFPPSTVKYSQMWIARGLTLCVQEWNGTNGQEKKNTFTNVFWVFVLSSSAYFRLFGFHLCLVLTPFAVHFRLAISYMCKRTHTRCRNERTGGKEEERKKTKAMRWNISNTLNITQFTQWVVGNCMADAIWCYKRS